jgi:rod shape-determining protein MreD
LYAAAAFQQALGSEKLFEAGPDYLLLALSGLCLFARPNAGAVIGFLDGWLHGALSGVHLWQHVLVRTLAGYALARIVEFGVERSWLSAALAGIAVVLSTRLAFMFLAPPSQIGPFLGDTLGTAVYNGVIAIPLYAVLNRIVGPRS